MSISRILVYGGKGSLGAAIVDHLKSKNAVSLCVYGPNNTYYMFSGS